MAQQRKALTVDLGLKLTSVNFEEFISHYFPPSFETEYQQINFSLEKLEWIGFEQLTILTGWIEELLSINKSVSILLQKAYGLSPESNIYKKRKRCQDLIVKEWKIGTVVSPKIEFVNGGIPLSDRQPFQEEVPFERIPVIPYNLSSFEEDFNEQYHKYLKRFTDYSKTIISRSTNLNYFDNNFLNYSLVKELYSNVCQHAYKENSEKGCYISLSFNSRIEQIKDKTSIQSFLRERYSERSADELSFFKTPKGEFKNDSFLELSFVDFGVGISESLKEKYPGQRSEKVLEKLSPIHNEQNLHSQVLEYAFLLFTSKYEFEVDLQMHDYIPRGLYIIKDIVKRYHGLIIARSRTGKVVFDFSGIDNDLAGVVHFRADDKSHTHDFLGTSITILLPTRQLQQKEKVDLKKQQAKLPRLKYFSILKLYTKHRKRLFDDEKQNEKIFYERFFSELCLTLSEFNQFNNHVLICFNFAGISNQLKGFYIKLIYFLSYSPLINEQTNALLFNVLDKGIANAQLDIEKNPEMRGFFAHIIPCIHPDLTVSWIGINDNSLAENLTENWKGDSNYARIKQRNPEFLKDNILSIQRTNDDIIVNCHIPEFASINEQLINYQERFILAEINGKGVNFDELIHLDPASGNILHNYNQIIKVADDGRIFLTSNGQYQYIFLSFIEKLYKKEYRRLIGTFLVFNFFANNMGGDESKQRKIKILTVTLSSQLLGKEVLDILGLLAPDEIKDVSLIPLSSYYEFHKEPRFLEIEDDDLVIVVNDVISTGSLSNKISKSINRRRKHVKVVILTIVDSRDPSQAFQIKNPMFSLAPFPVAKIPPTEIDTDIEPIWINPIINAPVTMSIEKSNFANVLLHPDRFLDFVTDESLYNVGLFRKNTVYHTYFLETDKLFKNIADEKSSSNFSLLEALVSILKTKSKITQRQGIQFSQRRVAEFFENISTKIEDRAAIRTALNELKDLTETDILPEPKLDFVFYPFLSSVAHIEDDINFIFKSFMGENPIEVYPIPRIMTPKGWRFTFPPKFLNHITNNKDVLILDDGSCSGETIVQMIDTVGFLKVRSITVLSIFARLEDYNREFFARIDEIKVQYNTIPVNIYFGTHFNIPIFNRNNHPYASELNDLLSYEGKEIPQAVRNYVDKRKKLIQSYLGTDPPQESLIPEFVSRKQMFKVRNILGRIDSYRLYKEDDPLTKPLNQPSKPTRKHLEEYIEQEDGLHAMLAVLIHEAKLIGTLNRIYPSIIHTLRNKVHQIIASGQRLSNIDLYIFYLRFLSYIDIEMFLDPEIVLSLFGQMDAALRTALDEPSREKLHDAFNYYAFILYCIYVNKLINYEEIESQYLKNKLSSFLEKISLKVLTSPGTAHFYENLIREFLEDYHISTTANNQPPVVKSFIELHNYFYDALGKESHPILYSQFQEFFIGYHNAQTVDLKEAAKREYHAELSKIADTIASDVQDILDALRQFKTYIHAFDIDQTLEVHAIVTKKIRDILNSPPHEVSFSLTDYKEFESYNNLILDHNSKFLNFIKDFKFPIFQYTRKWFSEEHHLKDLKEHEMDFEVEYVTPNEDITMLSHPSFFRVIYLEIVKNAVKYAKGSKCKLTVCLNEQAFLFNFKQNKPKIVEKIGERGIRGFRKIAAIHGASFAENDLVNYEFTFSFPLTLFQI